jgi:amidohydrolase
MNISPELKKLHDYSIETRRYLHTIPELSGQEFKTSAFCKKEMREAGYTLTEYEGFTGFTADLHVNDDFDLIAFRADMDALEMDDLSEGSFVSTHKGCSHNCGHDTHTTILLTMGKYLAANKQQLKHNVRLLFQMAEEDMRVPGADKMVELGCMNGVAEVYGLHNDGSQELGTILINEGIMSSYGSAWTVSIEGIATHGSTPEKGLNVITEGAKIVQELSYIVANKVSPRSTAVVSVGMFHAGTIPNGIADRAQIRGTIRAMDEETDKKLKESFAVVVDKSKLEGFKVGFDVVGYPAVINHPHCYQRVLTAAREVVPATLIQDKCLPMAGSEDFSFMINATTGRKGAMFFLGSGNSSKGITNYLHANPYYVDEDFMLIGAQIFINIVTN